MKNIALAIAFLIFSISPVFAGERLLYALRQESLKRYPDIVSTRVYSISAKTRESRQVFSDEHTAVLLLPRRGMPGHPGEVLACSRDRLFAHGVERRLNPGRWYPYKGAIYELSLDGSNRIRRVFDVIGDQSLSEIFVNPAGRKIGYVNYLNQRKFVFVHETQTGRLLRQFDASPVWADCFAATIGWVPEESRLFFTLDTGDVHVTSEESYGKRGTYLVLDNGKDLVKLKEGEIAFPLEPGCSRAFDGPPRLIGISPDKSYLFRDFVSCGRQGISELLYEVNLSKESLKQIPTRASRGLNWFKLSAGGESLAFTVKSYAKDGRYEWVEDLWVKNLRSGEEKKVFTLDNQPFKGFHLGVVGWIRD